MKLSKKAMGIAPSPTLVVDAAAKAMKAQGIDVIGFGAGEPDFDTPQYIQEAGIEAIKKGFTRYTAASGTPELKKAIAQRIQKDYDLSYDPSEIMVSCGAKHSLYNAFLTLVDDGDEVIVPAPYWVSYPDQIKMAGGVPVFVDTTKTGFKMTAEAFSKAITTKTKAIIINSPSNPTGAVYTEEELRAIANIAVEKGIFIISDDIYQKLLYNDKEFISIVQLGEDVKNISILINGVSKAYAMTGWRIGYAAANKEIIKAMSNIQSHATSNPNSIAMKATITALTEHDEVVDDMVKVFRKKGEYMYERFAAMPGIEVIKPEGAFYVFPKVSSYYGKKLGDIEIKDSLTFADAMLSEAHVALVAGIAFGADEYIRLSYATSMEDIKEGLDRFESTLAQIK